MFPCHTFATLSPHCRRLLSAVLSGVVAGLFLLSVGCQRVEPLSGAEKLEHATCDFGIYWPPVDPDAARPTAVKPLLNGTLVLDATERTQGEAEVRLVVTLTRPSTEADRESWNSVLAFADIPWMDQVRFWDAEEKWQWPNLPFLLRLPGQERIERYGGVDPGKGIDNDFAAVLVRKYDARGVAESAETKDAPLVSAEWHAVGATETDLHSIVHAARSDEFVLHLGGDKGPLRGQLRVWLIYADFLKSKPPRTWPTPGEWAGGILAYFEIDWEMSPEQGCRGIARHKRPADGTRFEWAKWVVRTPGSDESQAETRLTDRPISR